MKAGDLKHRVTVQKMTVTRASTGEEIETWTDVATRWAFVEPLRGRENYELGIESTVNFYQVKMRYESGLLSTDRRLVFNSQYLDIESVINVDEAGKEYEVTCRA